MNILKKMFGREKRATAPLSDPTVADILGSAVNSNSNPAKAAGLSVANACIALIAQNMAAVPNVVYRRASDGGREKATDHPLYAVLHDQANPQMTAFEAREIMVCHMLTTGNAFLKINWSNRGEVTALTPLDPARVSVSLMTDGKLRYRHSPRQGPQEILLQEEVLHLRYRLGADLIMGVSPLQLAADTFSTALAQQATAKKQAEKGFRPEGAVVFPTAVGPDSKTALLDKLRVKIEEESTTSRLLVLDGGVEYRPFSISPKDAEFLESRKLTNLDICRTFGVPPTSVGITDNATYSNVDQEARALVQRCLAPMAKRIEQAMNIALLSGAERGTYYVEHDLAGLLRGDQQARYASYQIGRNWGWLSPNEIRGMENLPAIPGGDEYLSPLNMTTLGNRDAGNNGTVA